MGGYGIIRKQKWPVRLGQYYEPFVLLTNTLKFDEVSNSSDITHGEKLIKIALNNVEEPCFGGKCDEGIIAPETDNVCLSKMLGKYGYLSM
jgi:hypothetical protein